MENTYGENLAPFDPSVESAKFILHRLFDSFEGGIRFRLWDGTELQLGNGTPRMGLTFHTAAAFRGMALSRDPLRLAEFYLYGDVDIDGDIYSAIKIRWHLEALRLTLGDKARLALKALAIRVHGNRAHEEAPRWRRAIGHGESSFSKDYNSDAIAFHYDVSDDFYRLWLDEQMVYSCAYYESADQTLEQAQRNKLDHICRKLRLKPGEELLDIGCGWGALICWAAEHYGVKAHGVTLSQHQYEHARQLIESRGLQDKVSVSLTDYRDVPGEARYDKLVSVGMFEHVGLKNLPTYFETAMRLLKPGGLFLNHGITSEEGGWETSVGTEFINRYVFPDGELETVSTVQQIMEDHHFEIHDVEGLRPHYALTLREWVKRLEDRHEIALHHVNEPTYRIWVLYMAASALQFEEGMTGIYQILASRRKSWTQPVPLSRRDLYEAR